eukprot:1178176-Prorocentrum_minimum.AAC.2
MIPEGIYPLLSSPALSADATGFPREAAGVLRFGLPFVREHHEQGQGMAARGRGHGEGGAHAAAEGGPHAKAAAARGGHPSGAVQEQRRVHLVRTHNGWIDCLFVMKQ